MRNLDFSSWEGILSTLLGLVLITVIGVGIRLLAMHTIQQRRERENRQINERLRTLIAAYKTLGGSFTGNLEVDPTHLRDLRRRADTAAASLDQSADSGDSTTTGGDADSSSTNTGGDATQSNQGTTGDNTSETSARTELRYSSRAGAWALTSSTMWS